MAVSKMGTRENDDDDDDDDDPPTFFGPYVQTNPYDVVSFHVSMSRGPFEPAMTIPNTNERDHLSSLSIFARWFGTTATSDICEPCQADMNKKRLVLEGQESRQPWQRSLDPWQSMVHGEKTGTCWVISG